MARVPASIDYPDLPGDHGRYVPSVSATCEACGYTTESYGQTEASIKRCLARLREECPRDENNFYFDESEDM